MDKKCAPSKEFKDGSCIDEKTLKTIAINFNEYYNEDINYNTNKKDLVDELSNKFNKKFNCKDQLCWLNQKFVKRMNNKDLNKFTFRPKGPSKRFDWLSTTNINDVIDQYEKKHKDFLFLGAVPYDFQELRELQMGNELDFNDVIDGKMNESYNKGNKINHFGMVINLDTHDKSGSHWVALYTNFDKNQIYFFDSFGKKPRKKIRKFINKITKFMYKRKYHHDLPVNDLINDIKNNNKSELTKNISEFDIRFNNIQHQIENTECGVYSINFIIRLANGESFDEISKNITRDKEMNNCREKYFNNLL